MSEVRIAAEPRVEFGKGAARRTRRAGKVPAVLYGHGAAPRHLSLPGHELMLALKGGSNTLLRLDVDGENQLALPRAVVRDPIKGFLEHLDLLVVARGEKVSVAVQITVEGTPVPDTLVDLQMSVVHVEAEATHIPTGFTVDVTGLGVGHSITAGQVDLPNGVTLEGDPEQVVVQILAASAPAGGEDAAAPAAGDGQGDVVEEPAGDASES